MQSNSFFLNKIESLRLRAQNLKHLRKEMFLPEACDLKKEQWDALESQLAGVSNNLLNKLRVYTDKLLSDIENPLVKKQMVLGLGNMELEVTQSYTFYDTYMDLLSQRLCKTIGELLRGCDMIAMDGMSRGYLADISIQPIVYFDRGFGAKTCREGVNILPGIPNPLQFIAIPYSRLSEKYNLISIYHEVGHQTLVKLNLVPLLQKNTEQQLAKAGASPIIRTLFVNWIKELGPDFWAFCLTGMGQTCSLRDILFLPQNHTTYVSTAQQHPPGYLRFLASVHWCKYLWGNGEWNFWAEEWREKYPLQKTDSITQQVLVAAEKYLPLLARILTNTTYKKLNNKSLASLFSLDAISPDRLKKMADPENDSAEFARQSIGAQLAAFRLMRENRKYKHAAIDQAMSNWLKTISN